jgi:uncharacterized peroxidase-related enzyme
MAYIQHIPYENSEGELREIYDELIGSRGKLANIHMIQSLHPKSITAHMKLYMELMFGKSPLKRYQRELLGVVVSKTNNCNYCVRHHAEALNFFWKNAEKTNQFAEDHESIDLDSKDKLLAKMANLLTKDPAYQGKEELLDGLRKEGLNDRALLDATLIIAYFNFVNRIVLNTGLNLENDHGGYEYE